MNTTERKSYEFWIFEITLPNIGKRWTYAREAPQFPGRQAQVQQTWASKHGARRGLSSHYHGWQIGVVHYGECPLPQITQEDKDARADAIRAARAPKEAEPVGTVDITPQWAGVLMILLTGYTDGTDEGRRIAITELRRMAQAADRYNALADAEREAFMAGHAAGEEGICGTPTEAGAAWQDYQKGKNNG